MISEYLLPVRMSAPLTPGSHPFRVLALLLLLSVLPCSASTTRPLTPLPGTANKVALTAGDPDHFVIAIGGDNRSAGRGIPMPPTAGQIFAELRLLQPSLVLWTGDAIYGSDDTLPEANEEYNGFLASAAQALTPIYNAPGNHEIFDRSDMEQLYTRRMGPLYGSFDYGHSHFIALDTEEIGVKGGVGKAQMVWLQQDLEANKAAAHIFAFMHHPLFPKDEKEGFVDPANRDELHALFVRYGVKNVISGHEHLLYHSEHDGVAYWVTGGAGAPTDAAVEDGGFQHYLLVTVDGPEVTTTVLQPWRLFAATRRAAAGASQAVVVSNYNNVDLSVSVELPGAPGQTGLTASASSTYKGKTKILDALIAPSRRPGVVTVKVIVPRHKAAVVSVHAGSSPRP